MKLLRRILPVFLCLVLLLSLSAAAYAADGDGTEPYALTVRIGDTEARVRAFDDAYENNLYLSLTDLSAALSGTEKQFHLAYGYNDTDGSTFTVTTGRAAGGGNGEVEKEKAGPDYLALRRNRLFMDGRERKYYSYRLGQDLYLNLVDIQLMLDMSAQILSGTEVRFFPGMPFAPEPERLKEAGYFDMFSGILLGDADTGEVLFSVNANRAVPIASLSKLMSYVLLQEAVADGTIGTRDLVPISPAAQQLSNSADGMVKLSTAKPIPYSELLDAMLLASSNESCLALAEYAMGSEDAFVQAMNEKAQELSLRSAVFYTPHGLPVYSGDSTPVKRQNLMSTADLFSLIRYLLEEYPQITDITSRQYEKMPTLDYTTANSNPMVFNVEGVTGLKTGSTNRAGYCLAASLPITADGETHNIIAIVLGSETADVRGQAAEILLRSAQRYYAEHGFQQNEKS